MEEKVVLIVNNSDVGVKEGEQKSGTSKRTFSKSHAAAILVYEAKINKIRHTLPKDGAYQLTKDGKLIKREGKGTNFKS